MKIKKTLKLIVLSLHIISCQTDDSNVINSEEENIFNGNVTVNSQIDVLELGKKNYTKITGNLLLTNSYNDTTKIHDLRPLKSLKELGSLIILSNDSLANLDGLENLKTINKELTIDNNALENINGLKNIETIGETLTLGLSNIDDLKALSNVSNAIKSSVIIQGNLKSLEGIPNIAPTVFFLKIGHTEIKQLGFRSPIEKINGTVEILSNDNMVNLEGLNQLEAVKGTLIIRDNRILTTLDELESINFVGREIEIKDNKSLTNFCVLNKINNKNDILISIDGNGYDINTETLSEENCRIMI